MQNIDTDLVAEIWQRAVLLSKPYLKKELAKAKQPTSEGVYADLARCFMRHNPGATVISESSYMVKLDVTGTQMWKDDQGAPPNQKLAVKFDKTFTDNGVMCFFAEDTKRMRDFLGGTCGARANIARKRRRSC